ncbi:hypothetical protein AB4865_06175 [Capnocytophaga sp. ARDL2]|uniref:hypothetical protein n=1 Tax=Capnocytophaga sp. ARDL2 TaxID=3238809 RepID=UPI003556B3A2
MIAFFISFFLLFQTCNKDFYEICEIKRTGEINIIYAKKENRLYKFISFETNSSRKKGKKIKKGRKYKLLKESIFNIKINDNGKIIVLENHINIDCIIVKNINICKEYDVGINDVYMSENLQGLYYIK